MKLQANCLHKLYKLQRHRLPQISHYLRPSTHILASNARCFSTLNTNEKLFDKILIANRGEIACRVMKTAKKLGMKTVAVYSEPDEFSEHVKMADEAFLIGPAASAQSYLNIPKILEVIKETGAQAVHPGYGFLSENSSFAQTLEENGVAFIGPGSFAIEAMGDKIESKDLAKKAGVNTIPGDLSVIVDEEHVVRVSNEIGYPVMIKASAGGGGKGMRIAYTDEEARSGFRLSKEEAKKSFGDDRIFVEKFVEEPRHIEIQLIADSHGNVCALPERECSIQRRNQKVLEEAPSVLLDPDTRKAMQQQAIDLAKAVKYKSAGTVEFLADKDKNFYFLEMNTRLQVEHPVTELVTGIDLVEQMIRVAAGKKLPDSFMENGGFYPFKGHAHEARVYAEDPTRGFLPSTGRLIKYEEPEGVALGQSDEIRCDSGITEGSEISMFYDPMICKLCTYGETREDALNTLEKALDAYVIQGVGNNLSFLRDVCRHDKFRSGTITTKFIEEEYPEGFSKVNLTDTENKNLAAVVTNIYVQYLDDTTEIEGQLGKPFLPSYYVVEIDGQFFKVEPTEENIEVVQIDKTGEAVAGTSAEGIELDDFLWDLDEVKARASIGELDEVVQVLEFTPTKMKIMYRGSVAETCVYTPEEFECKQFLKEKVPIDTSKFLLSPMPGQLISIAVEEGQEVFPGQELCVVEAMKMQNVLVAERKGKVVSVSKEPGSNVQVDELIIEFE
eukprot:maker-scaffold_15-snap-gene-1.29-mRNA-1 protein AED:0.01 eAED:0.01 QI:64/1/1/1/1/1/2/207/727